jgi:hypothetical protein
MSGNPEPSFDTRRFLVVFLGRGGLGLGLALLVGVGVFALGQAAGSGAATPLLIGGGLVPLAALLLLLVSRSRVRKAAEDVAEAAIDELI